ncbi:Receptor-like serine/threonine-protein kinase SD1-8 [Citrus sinensis]|uniref:Receptor-like serine/threonine-protein kinase SD1-8 n=1 Tax=Citrus sinensis TaxID=2711 RepID=A0ACB8NEP9_CITSI|nr:Receptor-like serine/threonine-protein kinase SD1-8 [Citrus sinensis]
MIMNDITSHPCYTNLFLIIFILFPTIAISVDTLTATQNLTYGKTLVSSDDVFELGFFSPGSSGKWYIGIWYKNIVQRTYVWVANRDDPLANSSGVLRIINQRIGLFDGSQNLVWSSNQTKATNPVAQLQDSGNFVLKEAGSDEILWQSFDYPTDTLLPQMKIGWDLKTGFEWYLTSWKSTDDPSTGDNSFKLDFHGFPEGFLWNKQERKYRSGPWNGVRFSGVPEMKPIEGINFEFFIDQDHDVYYSFFIENKNLFSRLIVSPDGFLQRFTWIEANKIWNPFWYAPKDQCDNYGECGPFGICDTNASPVCQCMRGFEPKDPQAWSLRDGSGGCVRKTELQCSEDKFLQLKNMKLPDTTTSFVDYNMTLKECEAFCSRNCSCTAYANTNITGGTGCVTWTGELKDIRKYAEGGQDLYVRLAASDIGILGRAPTVGGTFKPVPQPRLEVPARTGRHRFSQQRRLPCDSNWGANPVKPLKGTPLPVEPTLCWSLDYNLARLGDNPMSHIEIRGAFGGDGANATPIIIGVTVGSAILILGLVACFLWRRKTLLGRQIRKTEPRGHPERSQDLLLNQVVISSKRDYSAEKTDDLELPLFDFETIVRATDNFTDYNKLGQGGFGIVYKGRLLEGQEIAVKRLSRNSGQGIEEFKNEVRLIAKLQHRNLVRLLDKARSSILNWQRRFNIICGIARGLLYLHQDSRFRIIHRDLKASNILLDKEMTPKISDFGMARIFGGDQTEQNTKRVVGTYGYMSPEYAMDGLFSVKSDVFSFGVLLLETVWRLWKEGKVLEMVDSSVDNYPANEVLRCIHVGLLCVQENAEERPTMASVVLMLSSETATMPQPKTPGFCLGRNPIETDSSSSKHDETFTVNQVTVTMLNAR